MNDQEFYFDRSDACKSNRILVSCDMLYHKDRGYGFITEKLHQSNQLPQIPEINCGFTIAHWYQDTDMTMLRADAEGCYADSDWAVRQFEAESDRLIPVCFMVDVPRRGNYEVTLTLCGTGEVFVFAGCRHLVFHEEMQGKSEVSVQFIINTGSTIPEGKASLYDQGSISIALLGKHARLQYLRLRYIVCPTIYLAGDSTVTDQPAEYPYAPGTCYCGWGQMLSMFTQGNITISNHARSGMTTEAFRAGGNYVAIQENLKPGDYLFLQFGHNDQKLAQLKAKEGYRGNIIRYIQEVRERGANPVLITPLARNSWRNRGTEYFDLLSEYAQECIHIGNEYGVPVLMLHEKSCELIQTLGLEKAKQYFYPYDFTHTNDYGAYYMASLIAEEINRITAESPKSGIARLACYFRTRPAWKPKKPISLPKIPQRFQLKVPKENDIEQFNAIERPQDMLSRAEALDMVVKVAKYFPVNLFNDIYTDIIGHEWYAPIIQCAYQNGIIPSEMATVRFEPEKPVTVEEFLCLLMNGYGNRTAIPDLKESKLDAVCQPYCLAAVHAALIFGLIDEQMQVNRTITREEAADMCKAIIKQNR